MIQTVLLFILGLILICLGGDRLVDAAVAIAKKLGIPEIVVGATIVRQRLMDLPQLRQEMHLVRSSVIRH